MIREIIFSYDMKKMLAICERVGYIALTFGNVWSWEDHVLPAFSGKNYRNNNNTDLKKDLIYEKYC